MNDLCTDIDTVTSAILRKLLISAVSEEKDHSALK